MRASEKALAELRKPAAKRSLGGHGDARSFLMLVSQCDPEADLLDVELPLQIRCGTCKFLTPDFHEKMACWDCVTDASLLKWRAAA